MSHPEFKTIGRPEIRLAEECAEVIQALMKIERFGLAAFNPFDEVPVSNAQRLYDELQDLKACVAEMEECLSSSCHAIYPVTDKPSQ